MDDSTTTIAIKALMKYPGSKQNMSEWIVSFFPAHVHYLECYAGTLAAFFAKKKAPHEIVNDMSGRLINLFRMVRERGEELADLIEMTPYARTEYYASYEQADDPLEDARRFMVRSWQAHGYKPFCRTGWRNNGSKSLQPVTNLWNDLPARIRATMLRLKDAEIESVPALALIERYRTTDTLIYADPPYVLSTRKGRKLYQHEMTDADHAALLDALDLHPGPVVLSGYHCPLYDDRLAHWTVKEKRFQAEKGNTRTEVLWLNPVCVERLGYGPMFAVVNHAEVNHAR
jgi:DNA adenine methylase